MKNINTLDAMRAWSRSERKAGRLVALVPTMGFLHEGHLSLIRTARTQADSVVVSIFVNPTQFGPNEDFNRYPRNLKGDQEQCKNEDVDVVFCPITEEMYPGVPTIGISEDMVSQSLEGAFRPGHFRGVMTVVAKLFLAVEPDYAVFGEKDAQQLFLIQKMVQDLNFPVDILAAPTMRETDGLAMSSRNVYLSEQTRQQATCLYRALKAAVALRSSGETDVSVFRSAMRALIEAEPDAELDYAEVVSEDTFLPATSVSAACRAVMAVRFADVRLIDTMGL